MQRAEGLGILPGVRRETGLLGNFRTPRRAKQAERDAQREQDAPPVRLRPGATRSAARLPRVCAPAARYEIWQGMAEELSRRNLELEVRVRELEAGLAALRRR